MRSACSLDINRWRRFPSSIRCCLTRGEQRQTIRGFRWILLKLSAWIFKGLFTQLPLSFTVCLNFFSLFASPDPFDGLLWLVFLFHTLALSPVVVVVVVRCLLSPCCCIRLAVDGVRWQQTGKDEWSPGSALRGQGGRFAHGSVAGCQFRHKHIQKAHKESNEAWLIGQSPCTSRRHAHTCKHRKRDACTH